MAVQAVKFIVKFAVAAVMTGAGTKLGKYAAKDLQEIMKSL